MSDDVSVRPHGNPWGRISKIAARVGVQPSTREALSVTCMGEDGHFYDIFEVVIAVLDHIDKKTEDERG